jgi:hypothetical protein
MRGMYGATREPPHAAAITARLIAEVGNSASGRERYRTTRVIDVCARRATAGYLSSLVWPGGRFSGLCYGCRDVDDIICVRPELAFYRMVEVAQEYPQPFPASKLEGGNKVAVRGHSNNGLY